MKQHVSESVDGDLPLWWRLRLWVRMKEAFGEESEVRRTLLAFYVFDRLIPAWRQANASLRFRLIPDLHNYLARSHFLGFSSRDTLEAASKDWGRSYEEFVCSVNWDKHDARFYVYDAGHFLLLRCRGEDDAYYSHWGLISRAFDDENMPTELSLGDSYIWDVHFVGAMLAASGAPWQADICNPELRRRYWINWIENIVPLFTGDISAARDVVWWG